MLVMLRVIFLITFLLINGHELVGQQVSGNSSDTTNENSTDLASYRTLEGGDGFVCPPCGCASDGKVFTKGGLCSSCAMELTNTRDKINVALFIFDGVEILDFAGPAEVFAASRNEKGWFNTYTVGASKNPVRGQGFITMIPEYSIQDCPKPDVVVLPGGSVGESLNDPKVIEWLKGASEEWKIGLSVCNGAFIMAETGLLAGKQATTFHGVLDRLESEYPQIKVVRDKRFVDNGNIITTAGVSAGIDGALHVVTRLLGPEVAQATVTYMEYDNWTPGNGFIVDNEQ